LNDAVDELEKATKTYTEITNNLLSEKDNRIKELEILLVKSIDLLERLEALHSIPMPRLDEYPGVT
jgi:hypothetical protein